RNTGDLVCERKKAAQMLAQIMPIQRHPGSLHDAIEMQKQAEPAHLPRHVEVATINPDVFPRSRIPVPPRKRSHAVRQRHARESTVRKIRLHGASCPLTTEQPVGLEIHNTLRRPAARCVHLTPAVENRNRSDSRGPASSKKA